AGVVRRGEHGGRSRGGTDRGGAESGGAADGVSGRGHCGRRRAALDNDPGPLPRRPRGPLRRGDEPVSALLEGPDVATGVGETENAGEFLRDEVGSEERSGRLAASLGRARGSRSPEARG